jgi:membrane protein YqaA with SNARE-associated domain
MSQEVPLEETAPPAHRRSRLLQVAGVLALALALNLLIIALPRRWFVGWGRYGYLGVFLVTLLANASVFVPVPYPSMVARLAVELNAVGVALLAAAGSALGETTAFFVGHAGKRVVEETAFYRWLGRQLRTPLRAFTVLFLLSAPPNPFFDVAGLTAGSLGVRFPIFVAATFCGRIVRMFILAYLGQVYL